MIAEEPRQLASTQAAYQFARQLEAVVQRLQPFGFALAEGAPTTLRRPVAVCRELSSGPLVLVQIELDGQTGPQGEPQLPPAVATLAAALERAPLPGEFNLQLWCLPWRGGIDSAERANGKGDLELAIDIDPQDTEAREQGRRRLRLSLARGSNKARLARFLEAHPMLYSLATLGEFYFKHPLFGQVLCGGPCGISGAWQFTCTMGKSFVTKAELERNFLERPVFAAVRGDARGPMRRLWAGWEWMLRQALWPPIVARKAIVGLSARMPPAWFGDSGAWRGLLTRVFNHLECPKSLRNGACGAPTVDGRCGELLKYGISKPCVFHYRNSRDLAGQRSAARLARWAAGLRARKLSWLAAGLEIAAAIRDRRPLSMQVYPRVEPEMPGASAVLNAMAGRFKGMTLFGNRHYLPAFVARSRIALAAQSPQGQALLSALPARLARRRYTVAERAQVLSEVLDGLAVVMARTAAPASVHGRNGNPPLAYERYLPAQKHELHLHAPGGSTGPHRL